MTQMMQLRELGLFDAKVPRYTSYPTAPQFGPETGAAAQADWIAALPPGAQVSLYVHVPFCRRLCWFCACRTQGVRDDAPVRAYLGTLLQELALVKARLPEGVRLSRLHWGGGTPTLLAPDMIRALAGAIAEAVPFGEGAEFSVEIDPGEIDDARLDALSAAGMNRASIGVQDFEPEIQKAIGRLQSFADTKAAIDAIRARGVASLNADILYGLPFQTTETISHSVRMLLALAPDRVALYGYAHVPWMSRRQILIPTEALPAPEMRLTLFETARDLFVADGYREHGIDHFALPEDGLSRAAEAGTLRRNFQGYTDDTAMALIGLGASAISKFPQGYVQNAAATAAYQGHIRGGEFAGVRGHVFAGEDLLRARMIEALMCDFRIDGAELEASFGIDHAALAKLVAGTSEQFGEMVELDETGFRILPDGRPLTRMIARALDAYSLAKSGHSLAI